MFPQLIDGTGLREDGEIDDRLPTSKYSQYLALHATLTNNLITKTIEIKKAASVAVLISKLVTPSKFLRAQSNMDLTIRQVTH